MSFCVTTELQCDGCGEHSTNTGSAFVIAESGGFRREVVEKARMEGWKIERARHLCPECARTSTTESEVDRG